MNSSSLLWMRQRRRKVAQPKGRCFIQIAPRRTNTKFKSQSDIQIQTTHVCCGWRQRKNASAISRGNSKRDLFVCLFWTTSKRSARKTVLVWISWVLFVSGVLRRWFRKRNAAKEHQQRRFDFRVSCSVYIIYNFVCTRLFWLYYMII